jgi:hypothetical protein
MRKCKRKVRFLQPVTNHLQNLHVRFVRIIETWRVNEDKSISVFWMLVHPNGLNLFRA